GLRGRNARVAEAVAGYRLGPRQLWAPVLLDLLAPAIIQRLQRLQAVPPILDEEEIRQQFLVEVLDAAAHIPLPSNPAWHAGQILSRANQAVRRWLVKEGKRRLCERPLNGE